MGGGNMADKKKWTSKSSRSKGSRGEYLVRDYFRTLGFSADRVPASGAAHGFKGDVKVTAGGKDFYVEVKLRRDSFKNIYTFFFDGDHASSSLHFIYGNFCIDISTVYSDISAENQHYTLLPETALTKHKRALSKLVKIHEFVKTCDFLVIKDNSKPLLFIRYVNLAEVAPI